MQNQQQQERPNKGDALGLLYSLCNVHSTTLAVFMRYGFGRNALGWPAFIGMCLILFVAIYTRDPTVFYLFWAWLAAQISQRICTVWILRNRVWHSYYAGYPWLAMMVPFIRKEKTAREIVEPLICMAVGGLLTALSPTIGMYVMAGFLTFLLRNGIEGEVERKRLERMSDAAIEQSYFAQRYRNQ